ncbi:MAG: class II aldolase/adducin family protein, partial [Acidimicrobiia bacterium]
MSAQDLREAVAWGCRILAMGGHVDMTLGHLSGSGQDGRIFIKRKGLSLGEVTPNDVIVIDLDGAVLEGAGEPHLETTLHTEVYRARPDVGAV